MSTETGTIHDDSEDIGSNPSDNPSFRDVLDARMSRRALIGGGIATAAAVGFLSGTTASVLDATGAEANGASGSRLGFQSVPVGSLDTIVVPDGYVAEILIPWGTPLASTGPAWKKDGSNTAAEVAQQVGQHHDGMHYFPLGRGKERNQRGLLVLNHEYIDRTIFYSEAEGLAPMSLGKVAKALEAHGVTVIEVALEGGKWKQVDSAYNRRVTGTTPVGFSGPVPSDHPLLQSNNAPMGTLNNCAHGYTPWGTYLACEENFNGYFGTAAPGFAPTALQSRYGFNAGGFGYQWHLGDPRFDIAVNPNEAHRFGWVVEIDPMDPSSMPTKRTALGRFKHEGATVTEARGGQVVVYSGDDENKEYIYKYVSSRAWRRMRRDGISPLDEGTLYVAKFNDDGSGEWLPLVFGTGPLTPANQWVDQADVLLRARQAADALGATKMDRPEWVAVDPKSNDVFVTLTNGSSASGAANPRANNVFGHIIKWREKHKDAAALTFEWDVFVLAGDPAIDPLVNINGDMYGSPDGLWFDDGGRLWIQTDISNGTQNVGNYANIGNNQMLAANPKTGETRRFLVGPRGCEVTGVVTTPDQTTMFVNIQHPGESSVAWGNPTPANPRAVSNWPDHDPAGRPRSATVVIRKIGGGVIGS